MDQGVQSGIRISLIDNQVITYVKDSDDVSYRQCTSLPRYKPWENFYIALASKNEEYDNDTFTQPLMTDVDINYMHIASINVPEDE